MKLINLKDFYKNKAKLQKYNNVVEAAHWAKLIRRCSGTSVNELRSQDGNQIVSNFSYTGLLFFIVWSSAYFYCTFITYYYDQTILRELYNTRLNRYGDDFERCTSVIYVLFILVLLPFRLSGNQKLLQKIVDIDVIIQNAGDIIDYYGTARRALRITIGQFFIYVIRLICIWLSLKSSISIPFEKMFQVSYSDALAVIMSTLFCYHVMILRDRFKWINKTLGEIKVQKSWEYKVFVRGSVPPKMVKVVELQERDVCKKLRTCARVYSMLYETCGMINRLFGLAILVTLFHYFNYLILYLFYFMEATASGFFHDTSRYINFVIYTFWEIVIAIGIILLIVGFSEATVNQAKKTSCLIHEIINEDLSLPITQGAMQLSIQILHEKPVFTVLGLFDLNSAFLQQAVRNVFTYLIILLQFVTEAK